LVFLETRSAPTRSASYPLDKLSSNWVQSPHVGSHQRSHHAVSCHRSSITVISHSISHSISQRSSAVTNHQSTVITHHSSHQSSVICGESSVIIRSSGFCQSYPSSHHIGHFNHQSSRIANCSEIVDPEIDETTHLSRASSRVVSYRMWDIYGTVHHTRREDVLKALDFISSTNQSHNMTSAGCLLFSPQTLPRLRSRSRWSQRLLVSFKNTFKS
jgi:hypothetical protein